MKQSGLVVSGTYADAGELPASIADVSEDDVPDELEDIIDRLLTSLRDPDTVVSIQFCALFEKSSNY